VATWTTLYADSSGSSSAWLNLHPPESGGRVTVTIDSVSGGVQGWSFGLCHDGEKARVAEFGLTPELATVRHGFMPEFVACEEAFDAETGRRGIVQAILLAFREALVLPTRSGGFPVLDVRYEIVGAATSTVMVCGDLRGSGQPIAVAITQDGTTVTPSKIPTSTLSPSAKNAWFGIAPPVSDSDVVVSIDASNAGVQAWSLGLCHDPAASDLLGFGETPELAALLAGLPSAFVLCEEAGDGARAGLVQAVALFKTAEEVSLPARPGGFPVLRATYSASEETYLEACGGLVGSGQPVPLVITADAESLVPSKPATATLVPRTPSSRLSYRVEPPESGEVVAVKLYADDLRIQGWSFTLCHTAGAARVVQLATAPEVLSLVGGEPPEFVLNDILAAGPFVAVTQKVLLGTPESPRAFGPFPEGLPILGIRYDVVQNDSLKFCDMDPWSAVTFENDVLVDGVRYVPWTRVGGRLVTDALGTEFIRGDADLNGIVQLTDAVVILMALFLSGAPLECLDAADSNDVARVDISDPIFILHYLFMGGPEPPPPFPDPGADLSPQTSLGCERGL
jgi:hypothetical protein